MFRRAAALAVIATAWAVICWSAPYCAVKQAAADGIRDSSTHANSNSVPGSLMQRIISSIPSKLVPGQSASPFRVSLAFGRTFGTSTDLDYATLEVSRHVRDYSGAVASRSVSGEIHFCLLASHVTYREGVIERVKKLDFHDGYEVGVVPKSHITLPPGPLGLIPYLEGGAGIGYVSETYRNSGSRWNWSLLGGMGMERTMAGNLDFSFGLRWRHLSNGNMWGKGDELHNSNSGTDMVQGLVALVQRF